MTLRRLTSAVVLGLAIGACSVAGAGAALEIGPTPTLTVRVAGEISPRMRPADERSPIAVTAHAEVASVDGTQHPLPLRQAAFAIDRAVAFDAEGLPACGYRLIATPDTDQARRSCRRSIVGSGRAVVEFAYPENSPIPVEGDLTVFYGGVVRGATTLLVRGYTPIPAPKALVAKVEIRKRQDGRYGHVGSVSVPVLGDGYGSLLSFDLTIGRSFNVAGARKSYLTARCPDGGVRIELGPATFKDRWGSVVTLKPGFPELADPTVVPCAPRP